VINHEFRPLLCETCIHVVIFVQKQSHLHEIARGSSKPILSLGFKITDHVLVMRSICSPFYSRWLRHVTPGVTSRRSKATGTSVPRQVYRQSPSGDIHPSEFASPSAVDELIRKLFGPHLKALLLHRPRCTMHVTSVHERRSAPGSCDGQNQSTRFWGWNGLDQHASMLSAVRCVYESFAFINFTAACTTRSLPHHSYPRKLAQVASRLLCSEFDSSCCGCPHHHGYGYYALVIGLLPARNSLSGSPVAMHLNLQARCSVKSLSTPLVYITPCQQCSAGGAMLIMV